MKSVHFSFNDYLHKQDENELRKNFYPRICSFPGIYFAALAESRIFNLLTLIIIIINTILLALQSVPDIKARIGWYIAVTDSIFLSYYIIEIVLKFLAYRLHFFKDIWNLFDLVIVVAANVEYFVLVITMYIQIEGSEIFHIFNFLRALRATRAIRALRAIRFLKKLQIIVTTVLRSVPAFSSLFLLIGLVAFNFAVIGRGFYGDIAPKYFGTLFRSLFTTFQLLTLDDWAAIFHSVTQIRPSRTLDFYLYLILFMGTEAFIFINLFVAVIVDNLSRAQQAAAIQYNFVDQKLSIVDDILPSNDREKLLDVVANYSYGYDVLYSSIKQSDIMLIFQLLAGIEASHFTGLGQQETMSLLVDLVDFTQSPNAPQINPKLFNSG
ncbi:Ion transporter [Oopsacas minuta]|uniref:Ion transporter n=1 Tax=Oopsacas minuta TaxID=111878 RepID=A0AAV7KDE5_9METZ|nr:Ion transporter [Oopsacas minuta]